MKTKRLAVLFFALFTITICHSQPIVSFKDENGKFGFKDAQGNIIVQPKYDYASKYENGLVYVNIDNKYGYVNRQGKEVIPVIYKQVSYTTKNGGMIWVHINDRYGFVDSTNKEIIPIKYQWLDSEFKSGMAKAKLNGKYGTIDMQGKEVIPTMYDNIESITKNGEIVSFIVQKDSKYMLIDKSNKSLIDIKSDWIKSESEVFWIVVKSNGKYGAFDYWGKKILELEYDWIDSDLLTRRAFVKKNGKWMLMDTEGNKLTEAIYDEMKDKSSGTFSANGNTGFFAVGKTTNGKTKYGFIDMNGKEVTEIKYDFCGDLRDSFAHVVFNGKYGIVDNTGKEIIKPDTYDFMETFSDDLAVVNIGGKWNDEYNPEFEGGKWGFIDKSGKIIIALQYDSVKSFYKGKAKVKLNGKEFYIDKEGNVVE